MFSSAEKTVKTAPAVQQKAAGTSFFKKAGEEGFFGAKENPTFFNAPVQAKLKVSSPDDPQEKEADAVADQVMRMPEPVMTASATPEKKEEQLSRKEEEETVQSKSETALVPVIQAKEEPAQKLAAKLSPAIRQLARKAADQQETLGESSDTTFAVNRKNSSVFPSDVVQRSGRGSPSGVVPFEQSLAASKGGGSAMPDSTRQFMESRFNADFSGVRIHTGATAEHLSSSIQAQAFAHGNDIYFNQGKFSPDSTAGRTLLAHELTHTIQQGASKSHASGSSQEAATVAPKKCSQCQTADWSFLALKADNEVKAARKCNCQADLHTKIHQKEETKPKDQNLPALTAVSSKAELSSWSINPQGQLQPTVTPVLAKVTAQKDREPKEELPEKNQILNNLPPVRQKQSVAASLVKTPLFRAALSPAIAPRAGPTPTASSIIPFKSSEIQAEPEISRLPRGPPIGQQSVPAGNAMLLRTPGYFPENNAGLAQPAAANSAAAERILSPPPSTVTIIQREPEPAAEAVPAEESFFDKLKNGFDATLRLVLPDTVYSFYVKIKNSGLVNLVKDTLLQLVQGLFNKANLSSNELQAIFEIFATLKTQLPVIIKGLLTGDCKPLFGALNLLVEVVSTLAGRVWDNLMAELEPIRLWLIQIWDTFGAPVVEEITAFAGEQWNQLKALGSFIWESFRPIREQGEEVWHWVVEKLGFGSSDEPGLLGYISGKLSEAWESIKTELKPVIAPINSVIEGIKVIASLEVIRTLQEDAKKWLDEVVKTATAMGSDEDAVANKQITLRQVLLPALNKSIDRLKSILKTAADWLLEKVEVIATNVSGFISNVQGNSYLSPVYSLIKWVPATIDNFRDWATDKVRSLFDLLQTGVEHLKAFFEPILKVLEKLVGIAGNLLEYLPALVLGPAYLIIPRCIKDPIIKWLTEVVLKQIPIISEFIALTEKWEEIKTAALTVLKQVFLDGQLAKGLWTYFKMLLGILGIDPQLVTKVVAKAAQNFSAIISKPGAFLKNIWTAIKGGFSLFFDNIWLHLPKGALDWLFGEVKGATQVAPPKDFSVGSLFGFVLELFGITKENVYDRMSKNPRIGPEKVKRIRQIEKALTGALEWITVWIKEGPEGLLKKIKKEVGDLKNMIIQGVVTWVSTRITAEITKKLVTSADPLGIGATLNTIKLVYDALKTAVAYINRMLNLVNSVMDSVADIISGNTKGASVYLESVLAKAVPFVVGFAVEVIIGPVGEKIKDIVGGVRKKIDAGIDFLINGALDFIGSIIETGKAAVGAVKKLLGLDMPFTATDGSSHHLYYANVGGKEQLMVASGNPSSIDNLLKGVQPQVQASKDVTIQTAYTNAVQHNTSIKTHEGQMAALPDTPSPARQLAYDNLIKAMKDLTKDLEKLMAVTPGPTPPDAILPAFTSGVIAGGFEALYISSKTTGGTEAKTNDGSTLPGWNALLAHKDPADPSKTIRERDNFVKMHLLHHELGGKASDSNLTPMKSSFNSNFYADVEKYAVLDKATKVMWYNVQIGYHPSGGSGPTVVPGIDYSVYPSRFIGKYGYMEYDAATKQWQKSNGGTHVKAYGTGQISIPDFSGGAREYEMNTIGETTIASMTDGVTTMPPSYADIIATERREAHDTGRHRKYASFPDLKKRLKARNDIRPASGYTVGDTILNYLKTQNKLKFS